MTTTAAPERDGAAGLASLPRPAAVRLRRPGWRDPRLLVGLVLVGGSVAFGSWLLAEASATTPVLVAREALVPGDRLDEATLEASEVRVHDPELYLAPGSAADHVVVRVVGAGELVPAAAVAERAELSDRPVAVPAPRVPPAVRRGGVVDLWHVLPVDAGAPRLLADGLVVAEVVEAGGAFAVGGGAAVHVLVPGELLPEVLQALAGEGTVEVLPAGGTR